MTTITGTSTASTDRALTATAALAATAGAALVVDTVTIAVINRSFGVLDDALFLVGFAGMLLTGAAFAAHVTRKRRGPRRGVMAVAVYLGFAAVLGVISLGFDQLGRHVFSSANKGLHGEWSFFSIGIALLALAIWAYRRRAFDGR